MKFEKLVFGSRVGVFGCISGEWFNFGIHAPDCLQKGARVALDVCTSARILCLTRPRGWGWAEWESRAKCGLGGEELVEIG